MINDYDALVVGCGLSGAVVARILADNDYRVLILERRNHIAGNMYDYVDDYGILVHKYGPHTFHTKDERLYKFMCRYAKWDDYHLSCGAEINGICTPTPFNFKTIDQFYSKNEAFKLKEHIGIVFGNRKIATVLEVLNCQDPIVRKYAQFLFDNDYSLYTAKQWGVSASEIDPSVLKRVPLRFSYEEGYFDDDFQVMPNESYTSFFEKLLDSDNITIELNTDALTRLRINENGAIRFDDSTFCGVVVYSGAIDELFEYKYGKLPYRSLRFEWHHEDLQSKQDYPVVAYPQAKGFTRIVEYNKLPFQKSNSTTYEIEYPLPYDPDSDQEPYYPLLTQKSKEQYKKYCCLAETIKNLYLCGRLANFKYYNMDQALKNALALVETIIEKKYL